MARPEKNIPIPLHDLKGLKTLLKEGKNYTEIADYYGVHRTTISRRLKKIEGTEY